MTFFDKPRANPGIARLMHRLLCVRGPATREALVRAVAPPDNPYTGSPGNALDETLDVCLAVGVVGEGEQDELLAASEPEIAAPSITVESFRDHFRTRLFEANASAESDDATEAIDLSQAIAWFLRHDPLQPFFPFGSTQGAPEPERTQDEELGYANRVIKNNAQWGSFVRWATFLGFAAQLPARRSSLLVPDPTVAVGDAVSLLPGSHMPGDLVSQLAVSLPVLDGGRIRVAFEEAHGFRTSTAVSESLSCALRRLAEQDRLRLENPADAPEGSRVVLSIGGDTVTVATIVVEGAA